VKLRIRGDSLRLRLTREEVAAAGRGQTIAETVHFAPGKELAYTLECAGDTVSARFEEERVTVRIPPAVAREWSTSDRVGMEGSQDAGAGRVLRVLVEKDFACLTAREGEDDSDAFPNPNTTCGGPS
jgi:hypothetical protein